MYNVKNSLDLFKLRQLLMRQLRLDNRGTQIAYYNRGIVIVILIMYILNVLIIIENTQKLIVKIADNK